MAAFLMPIAIGAVTAPDTVELTQTEGDTNTLQGDLQVTLDDAVADTNATYTVTEGTASDTVTVTEGSTVTATVDGTEVDISLSSATATEATSTFEWPKTYGWGSAAGSIWVILPILMVLAIFLFFTSLALSVRN